VTAKRIREFLNPLSDLKDTKKTAVKVIDGVGLDDVEREIVETRWLGEVLRWEKTWQLQRLFYTWLRIPIIIGAATVPVLAGLHVPAVATALVGLLVAILTSLDGLFHLESRWTQARLAASKLKSEGWQFLGQTGPYKGLDRHLAFQQFLGRIETINRELEVARLALFVHDSKGKDDE
jgi:hypothetical protein